MIIFDFQDESQGEIWRFTEVVKREVVGTDSAISARDLKTTIEVETFDI